MPTYHIQKARLPTELDEFVRFPRRRVVVLEALALAVTTLLLAGNTALSVYSWWGGSPDTLEMDGGTREGLTTSQFRTPATWTFAGWLAVFAAQFAWLAHGWTYVCRQKAYRAYSPAVHPSFWFVNCVNIGYVYAIANRANELSLALVAVEALALCVSVAIVSVSLHRNATGLKDFSSVDIWSTRLLALNGLALYASWAVLSTLFHTASVLKEDTELHHDTITTCLLSLTGAIGVVYFLLEATILDRYIRYVISVYPAVMWWLGGILGEHWDEKFHEISRNNLLTFVILVAVGGLFLVHLVLMVVFGCLRPLTGGGAREDIDGVAQIPD